MDAAGALYRCQVRHRRPGVPRYRFRYRSFYLLLDIDAIDVACAASPFISRNRFNLLSFHDVDHGAHTAAGDLRAWIDSLLSEQGLAPDTGRVRLLTMPRVLGYGFHPISIFYCEHAEGALRAVVVEVHNTFGEHHFYVLHNDGAPMAWRQAHAKSKQFHVSPFFDRSGAYRFHFTALEERFGVGIRLFDDSGETLRIATTLTGERRPLSSLEILRAALSTPLMTAKVTAAIHWQALKLWLRGSIYYPKPRRKRSNTS